MMYKKTMATLITGLMMLCIFTSIGISDSVEVEKSNELIQKSDELKLESFMHDVRKSLTDIIEDEKYWQGRLFGTPGEVKAAEILYKSLKDIVPQIEYNELKRDFCKKIGINSPEDILLTINGQNISDSEIFPMFTPTKSNKEHFFENAKVILPPNIIYNKKCEEKILPPKLNPKTKYIYLLDMSYFETDYDVYLTVFKLFLYTRMNPLWPAAEAFLCADYNEKTHFMPPTSQRVATMSFLPGFMISGELGNKIKNEQAVVDKFYINQNYKTNFSSKNVIVTLPGESNETIFIGTKLDSMSCRGAADDSGSMSVVWGVAKYFAEKNIKLNYTLKFGAWAAEEFNKAGSKSYIESNSGENIRYYIGLGAIGYKNHSNMKKSDLHLNVHSTKNINSSLKQVINNFDYPQKSGGYGEVKYLMNDPMITKTDAGSFIDHATKNVFSIDKGDFSTATHWYHRSGGDHKYGDVPEILDDQDIQTVAELIIEIVKHLNSESN